MAEEQGLQVKLLLQDREKRASGEVGCVGHKSHPWDNNPTEEQRAKSKSGLQAAFPLLTLQPTPFQLIPGEQPLVVLGCGPASSLTVEAMQ